MKGGFRLRYLRRMAQGLAGAAALGLAGCATLGLGAAKPLSAEGARQALTIGVSTKVDVTRLMGDAAVTDFASGNSVWVYRYKAGVPMLVGLLPVVGTLASAVDAGTGDRELAILFDQHGVVHKYRLREAASPLEHLLGK
ncbi:MAG: hypothetical protein QFF03_10445 [Pseudomonadota bacterium]|nr:hypothetical protein [Pseudomonadota bacterium]